MMKNNRIKHRKGFREKSFTAAVVLLVMIILISIGNIGSYLYEERKGRMFFRELQESAIIEEKEGPEKGVTGESVSSDIPAAVDFESLRKISKDAAAWIYSPGTEINYVVAQAEDNSYYLHRLLDKTETDCGTLFMDYRNNADLSDWNTIIYGHNMKSGAMFASIPDYQDPGYYEKHPVMYLYTPGKKYRLELIAGYTTDVNDRIYSVPVTEEEQAEIVEAACKKSSFTSDIEVEEGDKLITLSTCSYAHDDARYVVIGRLVEE